MPSFAESDAWPTPKKFEHELAFAVSCVRRIRKHAPTESKVNEQQKKHLNLLHGIALFLVTDDKSDVAAVSFLQAPTFVEFFYAKNRPSAASEYQYVESMLGLMRTFDRSKRGQYTLRITRMAVLKCIRKVRNGVKKVVRELGKCDVTVTGLQQRKLGGLVISESRENLVSRAVVQAIAGEKSAGVKRKISEESDRTSLATFILSLDVPIEKLCKELVGKLLEAIMICYSVGMILLNFYGQERVEVFNWH